MANVGDLRGFKSYADWQAANVAAGGSGNSADVQAAFANGSAAAPPPAQQTQAPAGGAPSGHPAGMSADQQAQWAHDNIDSTIDVNTWKQQGPMDSSCPQDSPYRSSRAGGDNACVEKPDNCPEGKTLDYKTCITNEAANQKYGGGYGGVPQQGKQGAAPGAAPAQSGAQSLQDQLVNMYQNRQGMFTGMAQGGQSLAGGGIFTGQTPGGVNPAALASAVASTGSGATPLSAGVKSPTQPASDGGGGGSTSTFATGVGNLASSLANSFGTQSATAAPDNSSTSGSGQLQNTLKKAYPDPTLWWTKGAAGLRAV